jgi:hypothetical protein
MWDDGNTRGSLMFIALVAAMVAAAVLVLT